LGLVRTTIATVVLWTPGQGINHYIILALIIHECNHRHHPVTDTRIKKNPNPTKSITITLAFVFPYTRHPLPTTSDKFEYMAPR
jgi:hypothetical protein